MRTAGTSPARAAAGGRRLARATWTTQRFPPQQTPSTRTATIEDTAQTAAPSRARRNERTPHDAGSRGTGTAFAFTRRIGALRSDLRRLRAAASWLQRTGTGVTPGP